jgi:hypothetical protein
MRADCVEAVTQAALQMGRKITQTDLRGIEDVVTQKYKALAISDRKKFSAMTEAERLTEASKMAAEEIAHKAIKKRQRAELQILRDAEFDVTFGHMLDRGLTPADAMERLLMFRSDGKGGLVSIESKVKARDAFWKTQLMDLWKMEHKNAINLFTDKKMQYDFVKELYGQDSGNAVAKKAAEGYKTVAENIRNEMNDAGFDIRKLDDYRSPQKLSYWKVFKAALNNREALINDFAKHLDRSRYAEKDGSPITDEGFRDFIDKSIQTIITDGQNKEKAKGTGSAANRGSQSRELHWKDADSFMEIMNKYSETNVVDMVWNQIHQLASDMTMVETFGPNAVHSFDTKMQRLYDSAPANQIPKLNKVRLGFENMMGMNSEIVNPRIHRFFNNARQMFSAALLGSNTITQISDQATMIMTARAMNIPVLKAFQEEAAYLASNGHRDVVRSMGLGLDAMANHVARFADQNSSGFFGNANNALMQINGSAFLTNAVRAGFGAAMYSHIGSMTKRFSSLADLKAVDRAILESKGVTDGHWGIWKKAELEGEYLTPDAISRVSDADVISLNKERFSEIESSKLGKEKKAEAIAKEAEKIRQESILQLMAMTIEETHMASLQPSQVAGMALKGGKRGELLSELAGVAFQFKAFPIGMLINHVMDRGLRGGEGIANRNSYLVSLAILSSLTGGMALLLGDIAAGRDPRTVYDENDPSKIAKFGMQAMVKGGGIGILGDLLNPEVYEGRDPAASLMGPGIGYGINAMQAVSAGAKMGFASVSGDEAEFQKQSRTLAAETSQLAKSSIPFQNLWWSRAAVHNYMLNELHELVSPGYKDRLRGAYEKNYGAGQWLSPDSQRAPNFGNIVGQ